MDINFYRERTAEIIIASADTYLKEGLVQMIAEIAGWAESLVAQRERDVYRILLSGQAAYGPDRGNILLIDERIFTAPTLSWEMLSTLLTEECHRAVMLTSGGQHYCGSHHLNIRLPLDALKQSLSRLLRITEVNRLSLSEILRPLTANQKTLLRLLSAGYTMEEAMVRMHCSKKQLYPVREQIGQRLGVNTLSEMQRFMGFYQFMVHHERRSALARKMQARAWQAV